MLETTAKSNITSRRMRWALKLYITTLIKKINLKGQENLKLIAPGRKVVIALTHISDIDVPLGSYALSEYFDIGMADHATHHDPRQDLIPYLGLLLAGKKNFFPVDAVNNKQPQKKEESVKGLFNPENYEVMVKAMSQGKTITMSVHNVTYDGVLPPRAGYGIIYLAQIANALVLPVAVNVKGSVISGKAHWLEKLNKNINRADAEVIIGKPMEIEKLQVEKIKEIWKKDPNDRTSKDQEEFDKLRGEMRNQAGEVMKALAALLPSEKRGIWT